MSSLINTPGKPDSSKVATSGTRAARRGDGQHSQFSVSDQAHRGGTGGDSHAVLSRHHRLQGRRGAAIGHVLDLDPGLLEEQLGREVGG
jgi:hypothetical protein